MSGFLLTASAGHAQGRLPKGCLDKLIDWSDPWTLKPDGFKAVVEDLAAKKSDPIFYSHADNSGVTSYYIITREITPSRGTKPSLFAGNLPLSYFKASFRSDKLVRIVFKIGEHDPKNSGTGKASEQDVERLRTDLNRLTGDSSPQPYGERITLWRSSGYQVQLFESKIISPVAVDHPGVFQIEISPNDENIVPAQAEKVPQPVQHLKADLDTLLNFQTFWQWSASDLERNYVLKLEDQEKQPKPPQFEWMSASKDRARFSRHMFSNAETNLTMFGGSIKVEEAILEFVNGKAARATISFYNRGDSGDITTAEFDRIFKLIGQNLSQVMKVAPKRQILSSNAALPVAGWNWSAPGGIALLEYNEYNAPGKVTKPEFLRLKLAAPNQADWSMGKMATGVQRMELLQRIKKTPEGDVYISGVPMVDQGQKGYCVAASCQRLFEYMRIPCDQHEMAKLVSIDAGSGADITTMQKSLAKIDGAFNVTFKPLINPEQYYTNNRKRRVSEKAFFSIVKEYTDKGVPLLWGLFLGEKPEDPPLPNGGQVSGGHMRMIIGYNLAKNQILFTDSWGAGHELKRMAMLDAYDVTLGLYSMAPRGF